MVSLLKFPIVGGISPDRLFWERYKAVKFPKFPMESGIEPEIPFSNKESSLRG